MESITYELRKQTIYKECTAYGWKQHPGVLSVVVVAVAAVG
jgi:hypothetical protein